MGVRCSNVSTSSNFFAKAAVWINASLMSGGGGGAAAAASPAKTQNTTISTEVCVIVQYLSPLASTKRQIMAYIQ